MKEQGTVLNNSYAHDAVLLCDRMGRVPCRGKQRPFKVRESCLLGRNRHCPRMQANPRIRLVVVAGEYMNWIEVQAWKRGLKRVLSDIVGFLQVSSKSPRKAFWIKKKIENEYNTEPSYSRDQFIGADDDECIYYFQQYFSTLDWLSSSNPWKFEFSGFRRNRTDDLGIMSLSLWPTGPRLHVRSLCIKIFSSPDPMNLALRCLWFCSHPVSVLQVTIFSDALVVRKIWTSFWGPQWLINRNVSLKQTRENK